MKGFVKMSKYAGMREDLVQAGGGNSACKISEDKMVIKASGFQLADISDDRGYAIVNHNIIQEAFIGDNNLDNLSEEESKNILEKAFIEGARPSIETFLHSISGKYSLHTHPLVVNALTCRSDGTEIIKELFPDALIVPYATPGAALAKAYFKEYKKYEAKYNRKPIHVFLMNHGFLVSADTADEVIELTENAVERIEKFLGVDLNGYHGSWKINNLFPNGITWLVKDKDVIEAIDSIGIWNHCFCPDCVVFLGKKVYVMDSFSKDSFDLFTRDNGYPTLVYYKSNMYIHAENVQKALEIQSVLSFSAQVMMINKNEKCNMLSEEEKNFLLNWDAEKYRKNIK